MGILRAEMGPPPSEKRLRPDVREAEHVARVKLDIAEVVGLESWIEIAADDHAGAIVLLEGNGPLPRDAIAPPHIAEADEPRPSRCFEGYAKNVLEGFANRNVST